MMYDDRTVEIADQGSRRRAVAIGVAAVAFLVLLVLHAIRLVDHRDLPNESATVKSAYWIFDASLYLLILATGGALLTKRKIRALMNDEVTARNRTTAISAGYWVTMVSALGMYVVPGVDRLPAREAIYLIVTVNFIVSLSVLSCLELRASRDA